MSVIAGTVRNGVVVPSRKLDVAEGTPAEIHIGEQQLGMREEDWPTTPEGREALIAAWESHEPIILTDEELADLAAWRATMKAFNIEAVRKQMGLPE